MKNESQHRVLVVDDEEDLRTLLGEVLEGAGYAIATAADGLEALELLKRQEFDAALLDIQMPNMNGMQVLEYLTEHHPATKAIILTGYADIGHAEKARALGAADFVGKPYTLEEIMGSLRRALPRRSNPAGS